MTEPELDVETGPLLWAFVGFVAVVYVVSLAVLFARAA